MAQTKKDPASQLSLPFAGVALCIRETDIGGPADHGKPLSELS